MRQKNQIKYLYHSTKFLQNTKFASELLRAKFDYSKQNFQLKLCLQLILHIWETLSIFLAQTPV